MLVFNIIIFLCMSLSLGNYITMIKRKYYSINFNIFTNEIQKWELKPMEMREYGSLHLINQDMYICQVIKMEKICGFDELLGIKFEQHLTNVVIAGDTLINGKLEFMYGNNKTCSFNLECVINFNDIPTDLKMIMNRIKSGCFDDILFQSSRPL